MSRSWTLALCLGAWAMAASAAEVKLVAPPEGEPIYGEVELVAEVLGAEPVTKVEFFADGTLVGTVTSPPYRLKVDVGYDNVPHQLRVVAHTSAGAFQGLRETPMVKVDMELNVELQQLYVTVNRGSKRDLALTRNDFVVYDNGKPQSLVTFERGEVPITAVVMVDASESMRGGRLQKALQGVQAFVDGLQDLDQASVMLFADHLVEQTSFSKEPSTLLAAFHDVEPRGGTAVNDHLFLALKKLEGEGGRPVIVLFSDGADVHSVLPMKQVLWKAMRSQALIYWIVLREDQGSGDTFSSAWRDGAASKQEAEQLKAAVEGSGGSLLEVRTTEDLPKVFRKVLDELREQYVLGYYPSNAGNAQTWHKVEVQVRSSGAYVRHRGGYFEN
jgi:Ca-activated chloride channel homolog